MAWEMLTDLNDEARVPIDIQDALQTVALQYQQTRWPLKPQTQVDHNTST